MAAGATVVCQDLWQAQPEARVDFALMVCRAQSGGEQAKAASSRQRVSTNVLHMPIACDTNSRRRKSYCALVKRTSNSPLRSVAKSSLVSDQVTKCYGL